MSGIGPISDYDYWKLSSPEDNPDEDWDEWEWDEWEEEDE